MKKTVNKFNAGCKLYLPPKCTFVDFNVEGLLCVSYNTLQHFHTHEGFSDQSSFVDGWK